MRPSRVIKHARQAPAGDCVGRFTPLRVGDFGCSARLLTGVKVALKKWRIMQTRATSRQYESLL